MATAEEKITEAVSQLEQLDDVKKTAGPIQKNALKIESSCTAIHSSIHRLLTDALVALNEAQTDTSDSQAANAVA